MIVSSHDSYLQIAPFAHAVRGCTRNRPGLRIQIAIPRISLGLWIPEVCQLRARLRRRERQMRDATRSFLFTSLRQGNLHLHPQVANKLANRKCALVRAWPSSDWD